jgi:hypothetical protein
VPDWMSTSATRTHSSITSKRCGSYKILTQF